jgi:TIR domain
MGFLLLAIACLIAIGPAVAAAGFDIGVPPQQGFLFGATALTLAAIAAGIAFQNRYNIWRQPVSRLTRLLLLAGAGAGACFIAYLFVYNLCVVEHPLYTGKLLFPLWTSGRLAGMIEKAGSRYAAVDTYGAAAVFDAISEMPGGYAIALGTLLSLYAPALAMNCAIVLVLALRYPSSLFRPSSLPGDTFDVFLCYNRADTLTVRAIAKELASRRIRFFLDEHESAPGQVWTDHVRRAIDSSPSFAVFVGAAGIGQWQAIEIQNIVEARLQRGGNIIPVFLPDAPQGVRPPMQLAGLTWVDFRRSDPDPMAELIRGVRTAAASNPSPPQT